MNQTMNEQPRQKLLEIIQRYGSDLYTDPKRCEALLLDLCGTYRSEINALINAQKQRIVTELLGSPHIPTEVLLARLTKQLQTDLLMNETAARWAVESWAIALGKPVIKTDSSAPIPDSDLKSDPKSNSKSDFKTVPDSSHPSHQPINDFLPPQLTNTPPDATPIPPSPAAPSNGLKIFSGLAALSALGLALWGFSLSNINTSLKSENQDLEGSKERLEKAVIKAIGSEKRSFYLNNECPRKIEFTLRYLSSSNSWVSEQWDINAKQKTFLASKNKKIQLTSPIAYFYAHSTDSSDPEKKKTWEGDDLMEAGGDWLWMRVVVLEPDSDNDYVLPLTCN
jgi:hypothetical protein